MLTEDLRQAWRLGAARAGRALVISSQGAGFPANDSGISAMTNNQLRSGLPVGFKPGIWGRKSTVNNGLPYLLVVPPG